MVKLLKLYKTVKALVRKLDSYDSSKALEEKK